MSDLPDTDFTQRFIFDERDVRGEWVSLDDSYAAVLARHEYPQPVQALLGELMAATALLVGALKFDGLLILQARSAGPIPLLMVECSGDRDIRGMARYEADQIPANATLSQLMPDGHLTLTIDPVKGQRYQGTVDLDGATRRSASPTTSSSRNSSTRASGSTPKAARPVACCCSNCRAIASRTMKSVKKAGSMLWHWPPRSRPMSGRWTTKPCCTACTTKMPCACSISSRCASTAAALANVPAMRWSVWASTMPRHWWKSVAARLRSIASSATSAISSTPAMWRNCLLVAALT